MKTARNSEHKALKPRKSEQNNTVKEIGLGKETSKERKPVEVRLEGQIWAFLEKRSVKLQKTDETCHESCFRKEGK